MRLPLRAADGLLRDAAGRQVLLRGVNVSGQSKVPRTPDGSTHLPGALDRPAEASFVGRPFAREVADEHFARLRRWGLTTLRWIFTWEAVEHAGPGRYDERFLDELAALLERAHAHGLRVVLDPHQDVWSRFSGGDGAPAWTLALVGLRPEALGQAGAALVDGVGPGAGAQPPMAWFTNGARLATATMFSLFWAGERLAPGARVDGEHVGPLLRRHYAAMMGRVARAVRGLPNVAGIGTMNEPLPGWLGVADLGRPHHGVYAVGPWPTPFESLRLADGEALEVEVVSMGPTGVVPTGRALLNPDRLSAWDGRGCLWRREGVWERGADGARLVRPDHFAGLELSVGLPAFVAEVAQAVRAELPDVPLFVEGEPMRALPRLTVDNAVHAGHWYDGAAVAMKMFDPGFAFDASAMQPVLGEEAVRGYVERQIAQVVERGHAALPGAPSWIGETGVPFDINGGVAITSGDDSAAARALQLYVDALDAQLLGFAIWNYAPENRHAHGDGWNREDFSLFCLDDVARAPAGAHPLDRGGRGLGGLCRPFPEATAGRLRRLAWDRARRVATIAFDPDPTVQAPTEVVVPAVVYPDGWSAHLVEGDACLTPSRDRLLVETVATTPITIEIRPSG